jgi:hypothetical protein
LFFHDNCLQGPTNRKKTLSRDRRTDLQNTQCAPVNTYTAVPPAVQVTVRWPSKKRAKTSTLALSNKLLSDVVKCSDYTLGDR